MILLDFNGVAIPSMYILSPKEINLETCRRLILNSIRSYIAKYGKKYGDMVLCMDSGSWRKDYYKEYKGKREEGRDSSKYDWDEIYSIINTVRDEIKENFPYKVLRVKSCEADDIIATIVETTQEFGKYEDVLIVSGDKDFIQLQKYQNVKQIAPTTKKEVTATCPHFYKFEHILRGCPTDGVPNILSSDDVIITEGARQKGLTTKRIEFLYENKDNLKENLEFVEYRNFKRNNLMINLDEIPKEIKENIVEEYNKPNENGNKKILNYMISKRLSTFMDCVQDFYQ